MSNVPISQAIDIGLAHHNGGRLAEAASVYEQILLVDPNNAITLYLTGRLESGVGRYEEAVGHLTKATESNQDHADTWVYLGHALQALGRSAQALNAYQRGALLAADDPGALIALFEALSQRLVRGFPSPHGEIRFACLGGLPLDRGKTLLTKEPETLEWIDAFDPGDVFWDVGANVGVYTLYAARAGKAGRVLAFEPSAENYMLLNRNIGANHSDHVAQAYCLAFNDVDLVDSLYMQTTEPGGALSSFAGAVGFDGTPFSAHFRQGMIGFSIDSFIERFAPPFPNRLKIDVDGIEDRIVEGAAATLADPRLKSLSIELDDARVDYRDGVLALLETAGLRLLARRHAPMVGSGAFAGVYNFQFIRSGTA